MGKLRPRKRKTLSKIMYQGSQELGLTPGWPVPQEEPSLPWLGFGIWRQAAQSGRRLLEIANPWLAGLYKPVSHCGLKSCQSLAALG